MKKRWTLVTIIIFIAAGITIFRPDWIVDPPSLKASALTCSDKCAEPPNPERPYFDQCGNEYDYQGNLISQGTGCPATTNESQEPQNIPVPPATINFSGK